MELDNIRFRGFGKKKPSINYESSRMWRDYYRIRWNTKIGKYLPFTINKGDSFESLM